MKTARLHIRIDEKLLERTKKVARKRGITLTQLVETACREAIAQEEQEKNIDAEQI